MLGRTLLRSFLRDVSRAPENAGESARVRLRDHLSLLRAVLTLLLLLLLVSSREPLPPEKSASLH